MRESVCASSLTKTRKRETELHDGRWTTGGKTMPNGFGTQKLRGRQRGDGARDASRRSPPPSIPPTGVPVPTLAIDRQAAAPSAAGQLAKKKTARDENPIPFFRGVTAPSECGSEKRGVHPIEIYCRAGSPSTRIFIQLWVFHQQTAQLLPAMYQPRALSSIQLLAD